MKKIVFYLIMAIATKVAAQIKVGDTLPSFKLIATDGHEVVVAADKTQFIVVDFWASWCSYCRKANKEMVKLNETAQNASLLIVGIALDTDTTQWLKAIEKDKINYLQLSDPNGFDAKTALLFGVEQLPATYLFDKTGKLIAINPTPKEITNILNLN